MRPSQGKVRPRRDALALASQLPDARNSIEATARYPLGSVYLHQLYPDVEMRFSPDRHQQAISYPRFALQPKMYASAPKSQANPGLAHGLTPSLPLERATIPTRSGWVSTRTLSPSSFFIERPYRAASPQASHRALPGPKACGKGRYIKTQPLYPRSRERGLTVHFPKYL